MQTENKEHPFDRLVSLVQLHSRQLKPLPGEQEEIAGEVEQLARSVRRRVLTEKRLSEVPALLQAIEMLREKFHENSRAPKAFARACAHVQESVRRSRSSRQHTEEFDLDGGWDETHDEPADEGL